MASKEYVNKKLGINKAVDNNFIIKLQNKKVNLLSLFKGNILKYSLILLVF